MAIYNLGSINIDHFYKVPHLPEPGETLAASAYSTGLGGKGANQSVAASRAGSEVHHIGAIGLDGQWIIEKLQGLGINTERISTLNVPTAHAIINVDQAGENAIVIFSSANVMQDKARIRTAFADATKGDFCVLQNETNLVEFAAQHAKAKGLRVVYSAAPFDAGAVQAVLPYIDILVVNEVEAQQLSSELGISVETLSTTEVLMTRGSDGASFTTNGSTIEMPAFKVEPVDTTGAGDTYLGFFVAGLDQGKTTQDALRFAAAGAAIQVTREGTADAIPSLVEVSEFLMKRSRL
jgi:ribokinase